MRTTRILLPTILALAIAAWLAFGVREQEQESALERERVAHEREELVRTPAENDERRPAATLAPESKPETETALAERALPGERGAAPAPDVGSGWHADLAAPGIGRTLPRDEEQQTRLVPSELAPDARFGAHVALSGPTAAVAAPRIDANGVVFVFERAGSRWSEVARLDAPEASLASFGASIALDDERLVVGAPGDARSSGAVLVYARAAGAWTLEQTLHAPQRATGDGFGKSVALARDHLIVGGATSAVCYAHADDGGWRLSGVLEAGGRDVVQVALDDDRVALVHDGGTAPRVSFHRVHEGAWARADAFIEEGSSAMPRVSMWHDTLAVASGAQLALYDISGLFGLTAASGIALPATSTPARPVAIGAQRIFVGEPASDLAGARAGAVLRFARDSDGLRRERALVARDASADDELGAALATDEALLLAGAPGGDYALVWELTPPIEPRRGR